VGSEAVTDAVVHWAKAGPEAEAVKEGLDYAEEGLAGVAEAVMDWAEAGSAAAAEAVADWAEAGSEAVADAVVDWAAAGQEAEAVKEGLG
jgi:hypothetical protein